MTGWWWRGGRLIGIILRFLVVICLGRFYLFISVFKEGFLVRVFLDLGVKFKVLIKIYKIWYE